MRIIDTMVIIASLNPSHKLYKKAYKHLQSVLLEDDVWVPSFVLLEFDLTLKSKNFSEEERSRFFEKLDQIIPKNKILLVTPRILKRAAYMKDNVEYFDSLIASIALEYGAEIISKDHIFSKNRYQYIMVILRYFFGESSEMRWEI